jgi:hypothetical protein
MCTWARLSPQLTRSGPRGWWDGTVSGKGRAVLRNLRATSRQLSLEPSNPCRLCRVSCVSCRRCITVLIDRHKKKVPDEVPMGLQLVLAAAQGGGKAGFVGAGQR